MPAMLSEKCRACIHEAGHAVLAFKLFPSECPFDRIDITPVVGDRHGQLSDAAVGGARAVAISAFECSTWKDAVVAIADQLMARGAMPYSDVPAIILDCLKE